LLSERCIQGLLSREEEIVLEIPLSTLLQLTIVSCDSVDNGISNTIS
jgi:hypothetical protein